MINTRNDLRQGTLWKQILFFSLPIAATSMLQQLFNSADVAVVGRFSAQKDLALAAVGSTSSVVNLFITIITGLAVGANVVIARSIGASDEKRARQAVHTALILSLLCGAILLVLGECIALPLLEIMDTPSDIIGLAGKYLRIYMLGVFFQTIYNFEASILRANGDTRRPLFCLIFSGAVNVVLNLVFVIGFQLDVAGVAIATVVSQCLSAFLVVRCLMHEEGDIRLELRELRITLPRLGQILEIGIPSGIQGVAFSLSNVIIQASINGFGETVISGNTAASNIEGFIYVACNAFCQANMAFTSQNYGAGKLERLKPIALCSAACSASVAVIGGMLCWVFGPQLLHIYSNSDTVVAAGMARIAIMFPLYILCGLMDVIVGSIRGIGYSITPMIVTLLGACAFRVVWIATIFRVPRFHTPETIYWSYPISWALTFLTHLVCLVIMMRRLYRREGVVSKHHHLTHRHTA